MAYRTVRSIWHILESPPFNNPAFPCLSCKPNKRNPNSLLLYFCESIVSTTHYRSPTFAHSIHFYHVDDPLRRRHVAFALAKDTKRTLPYIIYIFGHLKLFHVFVVVTTPFDAQRKCQARRQLFGWDSDCFCRCWWKICEVKLSSGVGDVNRDHC